jgi:BNR/Asp-box repeat
MTTLLVVFDELLVTARRAQRWHVDEALAGEPLTCAAADPHTPGRVYCGTEGGLWRSDDAGQTWASLGDRLPLRHVTAVAVPGHPDRGAGEPAVYVGTEPSHLFRSLDGGKTWTELPALTALPSRGEWSFPPRPHTHHVRWIEIDPAVPGRVFVAIEAGALVRTLDGGATWQDRVSGGPFDTHTLATHAGAPGRLYSAAGDGYFESTDGGETWRRDVGGLSHRYLVGVGVAPGDQETVMVSASSGPWTAYSPRRAETFVYRRAHRGAWEAAAGLATGAGTTVTHFAATGTPGKLYGANNRGVFRTEDGGARWTALEVPWPPDCMTQGVVALLAIDLF